MTVSANDPLLGSRSDLEMPLFHRSLEIVRAYTINQNSLHTIYFKNSNMTPRLLCPNFLKNLEHN